MQKDSTTKQATIDTPSITFTKFNQPIWRSMLVFLVPMLLSNALQSIGQLVSSIVIGRWLGVNALAAISSFFPLYFMLVSIVIGLGSGCSILIGQAYGASNEERIKEIIGTTLTFIFLLGLMFTVIGDVFTWEIMKSIGTPTSVISTSVHYARIIFSSLPILYLYFGYTTFIRGIGDSKTPLYFLILSTCLGLFLLPVLVFGWLGLPRLGVYGGAYSSIVSVAITFISLVLYLKKTNHKLQFDATVRRYLSIDLKVLKLLLRISLPTSIGMILVSLSEIAVLTFVNRFGTDATAAYGAVNQVVSYVQMPAVSLGMAVSIFAAHSIGANEFERLKYLVRAGVFLNYVIGGSLIILIYLFSQSILSCFLTSRTTLDIAHSLLMITLWSYLIFGNTQIINATMRASGTVMLPTVFSVASIWLVEVPVAYVLSHYTHLAIRGIWVGYPAAFLVSLFLQYTYYQLSWKKKKIKPMVN